MRAPRYFFRSSWTLCAPIDKVFSVLSDIDSYSRWWPEVRSVESNDGSSELCCRSVLPYDLKFRTTPSLVDKGSGILEAQLAGDLNGFSRWTVSAKGDLTVAQFEENVTTNRRMLNLLAPVARPAFVLNHRLMMRHGEAGLRRYLAD